MAAAATESAVSALTWLFAEHFRDYTQWPWAYVNSLERQIIEHPSFVICEFYFIGLVFVSARHAFKAPDHLGCKLLWVATFLVGTLNDYIFMLLPVVDNFWQAQAVIMLTPRMPLYIPCIYNGFMYWPLVAAARVFGHGKCRHRLAEASLAAIMCGLFYAPYDLCGARFLWWTWHNSDPGVKDRWLGVPAGSTCFTMTFGFALCFLRRLAADRGFSKSKSLGLMCLSTPLMMLLINVFTVAGLEKVGMPGKRAVLVAIATFAGIVLRELVRTRSQDRKSAAGQPLISECRTTRFALAMHFLVFVFVMARYSPETQISTGAHQEFGPCSVTDIDLLGYPRTRYLCNSHLPEFYFSLKCAPALEGAQGRWAHVTPEQAIAQRKDGVASWYTVCGQPHSSWPTWMAAVIALCAIGAAMFQWALAMSDQMDAKRIENADPSIEPLAEGDSTPDTIVMRTRRRKLTKFGEFMRALPIFDPIMVRLAAVHYRLAGVFLIWVLASLVFACGAALQAVFPGGAHGDVLQGFYDTMKSLPFSDSPLFFGYVSSVVFAAVAGLYTLIDFCRTPEVEKFMIQPRSAGDFGGPKLGILRTIVTAGKALAPIVASVTFFTFYNNFASFYKQPWVQPSCPPGCTKWLPEKAPTVEELLVHVIFCLFANDFAYWYWHWMHHRHQALYKNVHQIHHEYKQPFVFVSTHLAPDELFMTAFSAVLPAIACGAHPLVFWIVVPLGTVAGLEAHCGYSFAPMSLLFGVLSCGLWGGVRHHDVHHSAPWCNFQPFFGHWDWLCGTGEIEDEVAGDWSVTSKAAALKMLNAEDVASRGVATPESSIDGNVEPMKTAHRMTRNSTPTGRRARAAS
eukprot:TRINITY_DN6314_c0_g7_i1.p1 TRINITY_DN6314_c0_g7~~TRINITY_DN6314_c0_g7_i1.p1  ORF type:complete len:883 (-),score=103.75 TRINITY_DN6314_c0_g7_i1:398-2953(-)